MLDLRHLRCPMPVLRTGKALKNLAPGQMIAVQCTDPLAGIDIPYFLKQSGDDLLATERDGETIWFVIRKGS